MYLQIFIKKIFIYTLKWSYTFFYGLEWIHLGWNYLENLIKLVRIFLIILFPFYSLKFSLIQ